MRYRSRVSGPLLDRIDLHVEVPSLPQGELDGGGRGESSAVVRARVAAAHAAQLARQGVSNAQLAGGDLERFAKPDEGGRRLLRDAGARLALSARGHHRVLRVARTLADLDGDASLRLPHVAEALQYRRAQGANR